MANQGQLSAQKASASIGAQEAQNQKLAAQEASKIQSKEREGEVLSRDMERDKVSTLLGMAQGEKQAAEEKKAAANQQMWSGIAGAAGGIAGAVAPGGAVDAIKGLKNKAGDLTSVADTIFDPDTGAPMSANPDFDPDYDPTLDPNNPYTFLNNNP
jgi:high-affinity Fe2+/Pb2+ permease